MSFTIKANCLPNDFIGGPRLAGLKLLCKSFDGRRVAANDRQKLDGASMTLLPGYLLPPAAWRTRLDPALIEPAIIKFPADSKSDEFLLSESNILRQLNGLKGFPRPLGQGRKAISYLDMNFNQVDRVAPYFVMNHIDGRDLYDFQLKKWSEQTPSRAALSLLATRILPELAERLADLHERGWVHRDVKPNNALYGEGLTLLDLERANRLDAAPRTDLGVVGYYPPELTETRAREDVRTDVYGLGVTSSILLSGERGLLFGQMDDIWRYSGFDFLFVSRAQVISKYYDGLKTFRALDASDLLKASNLPAELKATNLGRYLASLFHPLMEYRPTNMREIAAKLRQLGGQFCEHELATA